MTNRVLSLILLLALLALADSADYLSMRRKLDEIEADRLKAGARVALTAPELKAYAEHELPAGVRNPAIQLTAGSATATALVDFAKVRRAQGYSPGWLMSRLLEGERPVTVTARIRSANGQATVDVEKASVSGLVIDRRTLDFLIQNFLLPMYPDAVVGRPFQLGHKVERLDVHPGGVQVVIGR